MCSSVTLVFLQGNRSYRQAHRLASLEYTEGIKQQRNPASNKMDSEDQLLRSSPDLHMHTVAHTCPHSPTWMPITGTDHTILAF